jgi:TolB-like protein
VIGDDVNVASRIEPFSAVGGVAISDKIYRAISSNTEFETKYIGKPKLKGVSQEVKVYCITSHGLPETNVSKVSAKLEEESKFNIFALTGGILTAIGVAFWIAVGVFDVSFGGKMKVPSVGILMMENLGSEDEEFWSSGMTADLITKVAGAGLIRVAPLKDVRNIDSNLSIEQIAKKLRVKYILTHSFLIKTDGFDLWCKLENIEDGIALFSNKISEPMDMATQMVGKLANDIITSLKVETKQNVMDVPTTNAKAYEYYLEARYLYDNRYSSKDMTKEILVIRGLVKKALELDNNLLLAKNL